MTLTDYTNPALFPETSHKGTSAIWQVRMDNFNYGMLKKAISGGLTMDNVQKKIWAEFQIKGPWIPEMRKQALALEETQKQAEKAANAKPTNPTSPALTPKAQ